ncbi:unnamed protein product, partial [Schistosoma margrebowiei]
INLPGGRFEIEIHYTNLESTTSSGFYCDWQLHRCDVYIIVEMYDLADNNSRQLIHVKTETIADTAKFRIKVSEKINEKLPSVCNTNVDLTATNIESRNSDSTESSIYNDDLSLSTIAIDSVESQSSSELNQIQNSCEITVSHQSIYQNSHAIVPGMVFPNDSHISDEIPCKSEENMLSEHNYGRKPDVVLIDANFSNDPLLCNDILNGFH